MEIQLRDTEETLLVKGCGKRQKTILIELYRMGDIYYHKDSKLWIRGPFNCRRAKDLIQKEDTTLMEKISDLEPAVLRLEELARQRGVELKGGARGRLNGYYEKLHRIYSLNEIIASAGLDTIYNENDGGVYLSYGGKQILRPLPKNLYVMVKEAFGLDNRTLITKY